MKRILSLVLVVAACGGSGAATTTAPTTTAASSTTSGATSAPTTTDAATTTLPPDTTTTTGDDTLVIQVAVRADGIALVVDGLALGAGGRIAVDRGSPVRIVATGDTADEVHIHGYDLLIDIAPGVEETLEFVADIPGIFEVEMEGSGVLVFELEVS